MAMDYPLKYVYTSHVMNLKMANKTNDADSVLIKLSSRNLEMLERLPSH